MKYQINLLKRLKIKYLLRITTLIPVFLVALFFAAFYNGQYNKELKAHTLRLGEAYIRQLLPVAQFAMMRNDIKTLQGIIDASLINPEVQALAFYDAQGQLLAYRGGKYSLSQPFRHPPFTGDYIENQQIKPYIINFLSPITIPKFNLYSNRSLNKSSKQEMPADNILGWLSLNINTQSTLIKLYKMYIGTIFITLFGLLMSLTIHYFLSKRIYLPIARLKNSMRQILSNEFETKIPLNSSGELGIIEKGCTHLQNQYLSTLKDLNTHVEIATSDLQQSLELLEEKNIELSLEKKKYEEKWHQKSEFIANISHEIRNPMNGVIGFTNVLLDSNLDNLQRDYVKTIQSSAHDLLIVINDILDYSKIDAGKLHLDSVPLDIRACIDEVITLAMPVAYKKGIDLIAIIKPNVPRALVGDPLRIKQILTNLISNAVKFTDQGHVIVRITIEEELKKEYLLHFSISDTGIGIPQQVHSQLFNAFQQVDTSITRRYGGSGLGLMISKKLAERMGGVISFTSEVNVGSTFNVSIKVEKFVACSSEKELFIPVNYKALCFDENTYYLESLSNALNYLGIENFGVNDWNYFQNILNCSHDYALILANVAQGREMQITEFLSRKKLPYILISKNSLQGSHHFRTDSFLLKPVSINKLDESIRNLLEEFPQTSTNHALEELRGQLHSIYPNILLAEDNPFNRMLLLSLLDKRAYVEMVENGEAAVLASQKKKYDVILLDLKMPKLNGLLAANLIRNQSLNQHTPILVISADNDLKGEDLKQAGIDFFLQKPIEEKQFFYCLLKVLSPSYQTRCESVLSPIDWKLGLKKVSGNEKVALELLTFFVQDLHQTRAHLVQLFSEADLKGLDDATHRLLGACCFCGVPELQKQVSLVEKKVKTAKHIQEIKLEFEGLLTCIDEVHSEFDNLYLNSELPVESKV